MSFLAVNVVLVACLSERQRDGMNADPKTSSDKSGAGGKSSELMKRIISGVAMALVALGLTLYSPGSFLILIIVGSALMGWEWRNMILADRIGSGAKLALGLHLALILGAIILAHFGQGIWGLGLIGLGACVLYFMADNSERTYSFIGPFYTGLPGMALVWLRSDPVYGVAAVLFVLLLVWMADIGAYAVGRSVGGPKLSPRISPNKTWSGALGGLLASALVAVVMARYLGGSDMMLLIGVALILAVASQIGDLYESSIKRRFGIKDSSNLIPGHGGILDRVDGLIAAAVVAALVAFSVNATQPGHAILIW